jgi:hypothetical protein
VEKVNEALNALVPPTQPRSGQGGYSAMAMLRELWGDDDLYLPNFCRRSPPAMIFLLVVIQALLRRSSHITVVLRERQ